MILQMKLVILVGMMMIVLDEADDTTDETDYTCRNDDDSCRQTDEIWKGYWQFSSRVLEPIFTASSSNSQAL